MKAWTRSSLTLSGALLIAIVLLTIVNALTKSRIRHSEQAFTLENLSAVLPQGPYDNDPIATRRQHIVPELGSEAPLSLYTVYQNNAPAAAVMEIVASNGYNGDIRLLLGITHGGDIIGVRVIAHRETPGLADDIDIRKSDWITRFNTHSLMTLQTQDWDVRQRGGHFDAFTGATITPRAIILSIHRALQWYQSNHAEVYSR